jgi:hypothetical protein
MKCPRRVAYATLPMNRSNVVALEHVVYGELAAGEVEAPAMAPRNRSSAGGTTFRPGSRGCEELVVGLAAAAARMSSSGGCMRAAVHLDETWWQAWYARQHALVDATLG